METCPGLAEAVAVDVEQPVVAAQPWPELDLPGAVAVLAAFVLPQQHADADRDSK